MVTLNTMKITKDNIPEIKAILREYADHDLEAFETRTEVLRMMMDVVLKLEELLED